MSVADSLEACRQQHRNHSLYNQAERLFCQATWDQLLCWPPTPAGQRFYLPCPKFQGVDTSKFADRECSEDGRWADGPGMAANLSLDGYTNYNNCFTAETIELMNRLERNNNTASIMNVAQATRLLELTGLSISLLSLVISLFIFTQFRSLQNHRTRIHKNLFAAIGIQVVVRMSIYMDQVINPNTGNTPEGNLVLSSGWGIHATAVVCEAFYVALEYARTTMFVWMFIEGLYLHNLITVMVFQPDTYHKLYLVLGWGIPVVLTAVWAGVMASQQRESVCWWAYSSTPTYWVLEGPRLAIILVNLLLLLNIIRVLVTKLRDSLCSEAEQLRKAVKAAIVLLPLLGITNVLVMMEGPLDGTPLEFALWAFSSHFLTSFQGFFVSLLYCFLNGEVRTTLNKKLRNYLTDRRLGTSLLGSRGVSAYHSTQTETERDDHHEKHPRHLLRALRDHQNHQYTERTSNGPTVTTQV